MEENIAQESSADVLPIQEEADGNVEANDLANKKYLKKRDFVSLTAALADSAHSAVKKLIRAGRYNSCVFYDDDFFKFDEGRKGLSKKEIERFVSQVCEEDRNC